MSISVGSIVRAAAKLLSDPDYNHWSIEDLVEFVNDAQNSIVTIKPDANSVTTTVQLVEGTKQALPADGILLLDIKRNMGTDGNTVGRSVTRIAQEAMDNILPDWHSIATNNEAQKWIYQAEDKSTFYVFPAQPALNHGYVEMVYSKRPAILTAISEEEADAIDIELNDEYKMPIVYYVAFAAYSEEGDSSASIALADRFLGLFQKTLGTQAQAEVAEATSEG